MRRPDHVIRARVRAARDRRGPGDGAVSVAPPLVEGSIPSRDASVDLARRRDQLKARAAELQFDLGGLVYEMAIRDHIKVDVLVRRATALQDADAELSEVERILQLEETSTAGACGACGAPHSSGAAYCWQCGQRLLRQVSPDTLATPPPGEAMNLVADGASAACRTIRRRSHPNWPVT